jgi:RNA ligase (TIGR02306 family)
MGDLSVYVALGYKAKGINTSKAYAMGGVLSQGTLLPMSCLFASGVTDLSKFEENDSVALELKVTKVIPREEQSQYKQGNRKEFPEYVPKTESIRLQHDPDLFFAAIQDKDIVITGKQDGCSATYIHKGGKFVMCGRNFIWNALDIKEQPVYFQMEDKFDLKRSMAKLNRNIAIQGEICGPKINGNRLALKEHHLYVFDVFDIDRQIFYGYDEMRAVCDILGLTPVPLVYRGPAIGAMPTFTVDNIMTLANAQEYSPGLPAEGIVVKSDDPNWRSRRVHFKVISDTYRKTYNVY